MQKRKSSKSRMVKLLKFINGKWRIVDYGVASKVKIYTARGYLVEW